MTGPVIDLVRRPDLWELERMGYRAALSVLCRDAVRGSVVADDLLVTAWPATDPSRSAGRDPLSRLGPPRLRPAARRPARAAVEPARRLGAR